MPSPEDQARENIDRMLTKSGWAVQDPGNVHLSAYRGLAIRNFTLKQGHGFADYLLYVDGRAAGVVEAKKEGVTLTGIETQSEKQQKPRFDPQNSNGTKLKALRVPLPPVEEQRVIVTEVERRVSVIEASEVALTSSFNRADRLRQAILQRAFSGTLFASLPSEGTS